MQNKLEDIVLWRQKLNGFGGVLMMCFQKVKIMHVLKQIYVPSCIP